MCTVSDLSRRRRRRMPDVVLLAGLTACGPHASSGAGSAGPKAPEGHATVTVANVGLSGPAALLHDTRADVYLVGNVNGGALERDGNGFISRLRPDGRVEELRWIDGAAGGVELDAPKGMAIRGDTLYVADIDCIRLFDRRTGEPAGSICPPGARNLSGMTVDADGVLWISDPGEASPDGDDAAVYAVDRDGAVRTVLRGEELGGPQGIAAGPRGVFFVGSESGCVSQVTPDGARRVVGGEGWRLEGIAFLPDGSFAFSNRSDSTVFFVRAKDRGARGEVWTLVRDIESPGELAYDARRERILIPQRDLDRLFFVDVWP